MKTLTAAVAMLATSLAVSATPAFAAGENTSYEQQAKLERLIAQSRASKNPATAPARVTVQKKRAPASAAISTTMLTGPERALKRLRATQPVPAGR